MSTQVRTETDSRDGALLEGVARGDERAFAELYDLYSSILFGFLLRILHSRAEAEDVLQEVFLQVWQQAHAFDAARGRPFTWLVTLARSRAIDRLRFEQRRIRYKLDRMRRRRGMRLVKGDGAQKPSGDGDTDRQRREPWVH